jgi:predicted nucleic acid-binding protein
MGGGPRSKSAQGGYSSDNEDNEHVTTHSSESDIDMVHVDVVQKPGGTSSATSNDNDKPQHTIVYAKSKVYIHPTTYSRDNYPGWISIVKRGKADYLVSWIPESLLRDEEKDKLIKVEISNDGKIQQEEVTLEERGGSQSLHPRRLISLSILQPLMETLRLRLRPKPSVLPGACP